MDPDTPYGSIEKEEFQEPIPTTEIDQDNPEYYGQGLDQADEHWRFLEEASTEREDDDDDDDEESSSSDDEVPLELPIRPHSMSSIGSNYASSSDEDLPRPRKRDNGIEHDLQPPTSDAFRYSPQPGLSSPLKRRHSSSPGHEPRPFKRNRGIFMPEYLDLLNADIDDAAALVIARDDPDFAPSQVGLTHWDPTEKRVLYESLARLGPDDVPGIATRIKTKGVLEVSSYLHLLRDTRRAQGHLDRIKPVAMPAAVELSQACCSALEEAADDISVREEIREEVDEALKWGEDRWLITPYNCHAIKRERRADKGFQLLRTRRMLKLADRIFMNASFDESNWTSMSSEPPAIRMTAHGDFYNLALSITRRLVAATMYVAESRIRTKDPLNGPFEDAIRREDVDAAVVSLGLSANSDKFWNGCARRLRLAVVDTGESDEESDTDDDGYEDDDGSDGSATHQDLEPMTYAAVEAVLAGEDPPPPDDNNDDKDGDGDDNEDGDDDDDGDNSDDGDADHSSPSPSPPASPFPSTTALLLSDDSTPIPPPLPSYPGVNPASVSLDTLEARTHTLLPRPLTRRGRRALAARIWASHADEAYADAVDARESYAEERRLWSVVLEREAAPVEGMSRPEGGRGESPGTGRGHYLDGLVFADAGDGGWRAGDGRAGWEVETEMVMVGEEMGGVDGEERGEGEGEGERGRTGRRG